MTMAWMIKPLGISSSLRYTPSLRTRPEYSMVTLSAGIPCSSSSLLFTSLTRSAAWIVILTSVESVDTRILMGMESPVGGTSTWAFCSSSACKLVLFDLVFFFPWLLSEWVLPLLWRLRMEVGRADEMEV